jgi:phosphohistidine phosphatase
VLRLMLMRHAKSDWSTTGMPDRDRTLNARGRDAAVMMGNYLATERLVPALILCSSATRTRQTCDRVVAAFSRPPPVTYEDRLYEAAPQSIVALIAAVRSVRDLMVIGHNPALQRAALSLIATNGAKNRAKLHEKFPTAALAVIDFDAANWSDIKTTDGRLERFVIPRDLRQEE